MNEYFQCVECTISYASLDFIILKQSAKSSKWRGNSYFVNFPFLVRSLRCVIWFQSIVECDNYCKSQKLKSPREDGNATPIGCLMGRSISASHLDLCGIAENSFEMASGTKNPNRDSPRTKAMREIAS